MLEPRRSRPRELSRFLCEELLYDYLTDGLDAARKNAVEEYLKKNPELNAGLKALQEADKYCQHLAKTRISPGHIEALKAIRLPTEGLTRRLGWSAWPESVKWVAEAFLVSVAVAMIALVTPWEKFRFEFPKGIKPQKTEATTDATSEPAPSVEPTAPVATTTPTAPTAPNVPVQIPAPAEKIPTPAPEVVTATPAATLPVASAPTPPPKPVVAPKGELYRMNMSIANSEGAASEVRSLIISLGGARAGQVDLGWRKRDPLGSYFHFTLPKSAYDQLIQGLEGYGSVRIVKTPHSRVMPEAEMRIILWIEDNTSAEATDPNVDNPESAAER